MATPANVLNSASSAISRILVPLDGSNRAERALAYAAAIAPNATLVLLHVAPTPEVERSLLGGEAKSKEEAAAEERSAARQMLDAAAERWRGVITTETERIVATGDPAEQIVWTANEQACDAVAMGSHGRGAIRRWAFGSVADRVVRTSTVPVLVVRSPDDETEPHAASIARIVVPYDGSPLASEAFPTAASIAIVTGAAVKLIQVINPTILVPAAPLGDAAYPMQVYADLEQDLQVAATADLEGAQKSLAGLGVTAEWDILVGSPALAIEDSLETSDLVVMTSNGRSGVQRWLVGSVAEKLIREAKAPVLLVPSAGRTTEPRSA